MEKVSLCLAIFLFVATLSGLVSAQLSCSVTSGSCSESVVMKINGTTNAHASVPSDNTYLYKVCCTDPSLYLWSQCGLPGGAVVLKLSATVNAHVQTPNYNDYTNPVCLAASVDADRTQPVDVYCSYRDGDCLSDEQCLLSISADTNAHQGDCNAYTKKVCCKTGTPPQNDPPVLSDLQAVPFYVNQNTQVTVSGTASDPQGDKVIMYCGSSMHTSDLCTSVETFTNPTCSFYAQWTDNNNHNIWCYLRETLTPDHLESDNVSTYVHADNTPPVADITARSTNYNNQYYGQSQPITFTTTATDAGGSGVLSTSVYAGKTSNPSDLLHRLTCYAPPPTCSWTSPANLFDGDEDDRIVFQGTSRDNALNSDLSPYGYIDLCNLTSVTASDNCGTSGCVAGNIIAVTANYRGQCGLVGTPFNFVQLDASALDGSCSIQRDCGGNPNCISNGINNAGNLCTPNYPNPTTCVFTWTIPSVPLSCEGKTLDYDFSALYDQSGPPTGQWFDRHQVPGTLKFFGDAPPVVNVVHSPENPTQYENVDVTATASDDIDLQEVVVSVYTNADVLFDRKTCAFSGAADLNGQCILTRAYPVGSYKYNATALDSGGRETKSSTNVFTVTAGVDTFPPSITITYAPAEIGGLTAITITAVATDPSGINYVKVSAYENDGTLISANTCASSPCSVNVPAHPGGSVIRYNATAADILNNIGYDPTAPGYYIYQVCSLDVATVSPGNCAESGCIAGNLVDVHAEYSGKCPVPQAYIQVDAESIDGTCKLQAVDGDMTGINAVCTTTGESTVCDNTWTVPAVASDCYGKNVLATFASVNKGSFPPAGEWFDSIGATGSLLFDSPPFVNVQHDPPAPMDTDEVEFNASGSDNYDITRIEIFVDNFAVPKATCEPASHPEAFLNCSYRGGPYPLGTTRNYTAKITDSGGYVYQSAVKQFTVFAGPDVLGPVVSVSHAPSIVGISTLINYTATATDAQSGVKNISLFVESVEQCFNSSSSCYYTEGPFPAGATRHYRAESYDNSGNLGLSENKQLTVCSYDSVSLQAQCGPDNLCRQGENIQVTAAYHGACPDPAHLQTDASDITGTCTIQAEGGNMQGIDVSCIGGACTEQWTIPQIPLVCQGRTVVATASSLRQFAGSEVFDIEQPSGSFTFYIDATGLSFVINMTVSDTTPNYGDIIDVNISCYVYKEATGERSDCDNEVLQFRNITIDDEINYMTATGWDQDDNFNGSVWRIPVNTQLFNSGVNNPTEINVTLRFGNLNNYLENSSAAYYTVNFPPTINDVKHAPDAVVGSVVTFNATIIDPEIPAPDTIDKAYACKNRYCTDTYCEMDWNTSSAASFNCTSQPLVEGDNFYWVYANDTLGVRNTTKKFNLLPLTEYVNITVKFPDSGITVPLTPEGLPNITRGMVIDTLITAEIRNTTNEQYIGPCDYTNCYADADEIRAGWDFFQDAWNVTLPSRQYSCNSENNITVLVMRISDELDGEKKVPVYIDCTPRVIIEPLEARLVLGQSGFIVFNATVYNPYNTDREFNVTFDGGMNSFVNNWLVFDCLGNADCGLGENAKSAVLSIDSMSSETVGVKLISPGRAGSYPIRFIARNLDDNRNYEAKGVLQIFSESLPEFGLWQMLVALVVALALVPFVTRKRS